MMPTLNERNVGKLSQDRLTTSLKTQRATSHGVCELFIKYFNKNDMLF